MTVPKMKTKTRIFLWLLLAVGCLLYCAMERWFVYDIDDYGFSTVSQLAIGADGSTLVTNDVPVTSLADAIRSQLVSYRYYNGRFLIHGLVQWLCGTQPAWMVVALNTCLWGLLLVCLALLCFGRGRLSVPKAVTVLGVVWLLMPVSARMMMGSVTAAADYLWTGAMTLLVLVVFRALGKGNSFGGSVWISMTVGLLGLLVGTMQESFSIGISAGLAVHAVAHRRQLSREQWVMAVCYIAGTAVCCLAPANFRRAGMLGYGLHFEALIDAAKTPVVFFMVLAMAVTWCVKRAAVKKVVKGNIIVAVAWVVNLAFAFFVAYTRAWQLTCVALCSTVLLLSLLDELLAGRRWVWTVAATVLALSTVFVAVNQYRYRSGMWKVQQALFAQARSAEGGVVDLHEAFEVDRPYSRSALAPVWRLYTNNFAVALINDNQQCCDGNLSKFLTRCENPELVKALLPDSPGHIALKFGSNEATAIHGKEAVRCEMFVISRQPLDAAVAGSPCRTYEWHGNHYYVYNAALAGL